MIKTRAVKVKVNIVADSHACSFCDLFGRPVDFVCICKGHEILGYACTNARTVSFHIRAETYIFPIATYRPHFIPWCSIE